MNVRLASPAALALLALCLAPALAAKGPSAASAPRTAPALPDSPAGRVVAAWFDAINGGGDEALERVIRDHATDDVPPAQRLENWRGVRAQAGSLAPLRVLEESAGRIVVIAREERGGRVEIAFRLRGEPPRIGGIRIEALGGEPEGDADGDRTPLTEAQAVANLAALADSLFRADRFSGVVRLERAGSVVMERAWGEADRARHIPNRVDTKFNLGSINKSFTRALIAKLVEQGRLSPEDRLSKHLPDFPRDKADRITIRQLLDMRSGLGDFFNRKYDEMDKSKLRNQRDWFPLFVDDPLLYEPGEGQEYSNAGYAVLGAVAEAATGRNYYDLVRELVYAPAGMANTDSYGLDQDVPNRAVGYTRRGGRGPTGPPEPNRPGLPGRGSAAGGGYSTAADLSRYLAALSGGRILKPEGVERFFGGTRRKDGTLALGIGFAGGSPGVNALLMTTGEWTLIVLANQDPPVAETIGRLGRRWVERVSGGPGAGVERVTR